jgi:hypothetical protein
MLPAKLRTQALRPPRATRKGEGLASSSSAPEHATPQIALKEVPPATQTMGKKHPYKRREMFAV